uniref:ABM domain-containing protein n=1 Tax=Chromera velia CCMP2878 TaxID=1169474 RepID=A0A0G4HX69_9ALVE|mmetsp:Transcript_49585/g.97677  ORF Transcript_49585/g.97677 Transcript_49585/m.97677 type:complete len:95 (-) Transcript_49585:115-399(-)|eukprot:Cvel_9218.t1-p1 / transcript=Cvel_9218.t1 / gene=Cvel_9218 / organism=Chromera_velia_CCMP2878 / gene_product=Uncharacterized protein sll1783, putative / transcript_product=Uncharacterized protein sll1783, putative / location=Cvel_scaffold525:55695-55976(+) / protein_length=94 / sequence_SO=supercontig / SO=protein_coding / is_pseudo=false
MAVHLVVTFIVPEGKQEEFKAVAKELQAKSREEKGCMAYTFTKVSESPEEFAVIELWADQPSLDAHNESAHFKELVPKLQGVSTIKSFVKSHEI